ncbi:hypothetical protein [Streptomyces sp. 8K308]|uniref:hypothetical protein n=1 Tax=Streptomyces sp. 8K308 TaxID=2530388 RepID=UPI001404F2E5|nr:hypothetical protein [Streptomyces sp. 8K308]
MSTFPVPSTGSRVQDGSDLDAAEQVFDLLMGNDAPREEFISRSAAGLDRSRLDL